MTIAIIYIFDIILRQTIAFYKGKENPVKLLKDDAKRMEKELFFLLDP